MKYRLLDLLCCPQCGGTLRLQDAKVAKTEASISEFERVVCQERCHKHDKAPESISTGYCRECYGEQIMSGSLNCGSCEQVFEIVRGIPRLILGELRKYDTAPAGEHDQHSQAKLRTMHAFGYQWTTFIDNFGYFREIFLSFVRPFLEPKDFSGKLVLEAGCGSGRPASVVSSFGAEVVAVDISSAVETVQSLTEQYALLHVVQADIYALPLRPRFDMVYSVGVLQHTPDPARTLKQLAKIVSPATRIVLWVYGIREWWYKPIDWLRGVTTRLPMRVLHVFSVFLALLSELFLLLPYRLLSRIPFTRTLAERIPGRIYANFPFRENVIGWFDRLGAPVTCYFSRKEIQGLVEDAGFERVSVAARPGASASWVVEAWRPAPPTDDGSEAET